jgi:hypothetical protein
MRYFIPPTAAIVLFMAGPVRAQEAYLCISDKASGMSFDRQTQSWAPAAFQSGKKYIFRQKKTEDNVSMPWSWSWALFPFGTTQAWAVCDKDFEPSELTQECSGIDEFAFNKKTLRFQIYYKYGFAYPSTKSEGDDTPYIEIGTCSAL